jgi:uncharacterized LabA/DUF88 family protein
MSFKVGVYVDAENVRLCGGFKMRYDVLRRFAERDTGLVQRLNTYIAIDRSRWDQDSSYKEKQTNYLKRLREFGWYIDEKEVKRFRDEEGNVVTKANADMELAIDALIQSDKLDHIYLVTGDGDFCRLVRALQDKGCRVHVIGFQNVSRDLRRAADFYMSGFLIPGLLPIEDGGIWGQMGSRVRGSLRSYIPEKSIGFLGFLGAISKYLWVSDDRSADSPYKGSVIFESADHRQSRWYEEGP